MTFARLASRLGGYSSDVSGVPSLLRTGPRGGSAMRRNAIGGNEDDTSTRRIELTKAVCEKISTTRPSMNKARRAEISWWPGTFDKCGAREPHKSGNT